MAAIFIGGLLPSYAVEAEDLTTALKGLSLEELSSIQVTTVYGASKHEQKVEEAPSSVTIITRDEIQKAGYRTLAEILNSVPGLYTRYDRDYTELGIRGFNNPGDYNSSFLLLVDGHRMNVALTANAAIDRGFAVDVDLIERVEVIRGPGASLYGDNAFFGVINVITRRGGDAGGGEASVSGGSLGSYDGRLSYGAKLSNGVEMVVSGSYYHSDGNPRLFYKEFDTPAQNNGNADHVDSERAGSIFTSFSWKDFTLEGAVVEHVKQVPTGSFGAVFDDPRNQTKDDQAFADLKFEHPFENDLNLQARLGYDYATTIGTYAEAVRLPQPVLNLDNFLSHRLTGDLQLRPTFWDKHTVTVGAQLIDNLEDQQKNYNVDPFKSFLDDKRHSLDYGLFLQDEYRILSNLIFNGGVRYDDFDTFGSTVNPRLALIYQPVKGTTLKTIYGTAFRAPSPYELYYSDGGATQVANPGLKPEKITTGEVVVEQQMGQHLSGSVSGFYNDINNLIEQTTIAAGEPNAGLIQLQNLGKANAKGLELALKGTWAGGWEGRASYSLTDARDGITGARLVNSPAQLAKFDLIAPLYQEKLFASLDCQVMSDRITLARQTDPGFGTVNFTLFSRQLIKGLELSASIYNLFDNKYSDPGGEEHLQDLIRQDGRAYQIKATYRF
jgi:iron complex outermembrane receptor protein